MYENALAVHGQAHRVLGASGVLDGMGPEVQGLAGRGELVVQVGVPDKLAAVVDEAVDELPELLAYVYRYIYQCLYQYLYM